jgi:stage IV sporulation protein B
MKKLTKGLAAAVFACAVSLYAATLYLRLTLPDQYIVPAGDKLTIPSKFSVQAGPVPAGAEELTVGLRLLNAIPVKEVQVQVAERRMVIPGGIPFGIKMFTDGVLVVGMSDIQIGTENVNPSKEAGLKVGDILLAADGSAIDGNSDIKSHILGSEGNEIRLTVKRAGQVLDFYLQPVRTSYDNTFKAGIWVRDSSAGIGTMTYSDPATLAFAGLGHGVCDVDTGRLMPLSSGEIVDVNISGSKAGESGKPGELKGSFTGGEALGLLISNSERGVFGVLSGQP